MARIDSKLCTCRNCGHKQMVSYYDDSLIASDKSCSVCKECGFKSIWFYEEVKVSKEALEKILTNNNNPTTPLVDLMMSQKDLLDSTDFMASSPTADEIANMEEHQRTLDAIANMLKHSKAQGLEVEVIWSFANEMGCGGNIIDAANHSLNEWDC